MNEQTRQLIRDARVTRQWLQERGGTFFVLRGFDGRPLHECHTDLASWESHDGESWWFASGYYRDIPGYTEP